MLFPNGLEILELRENDCNQLEADMNTIGYDRIRSNVRLVAENDMQSQRDIWLISCGASLEVLTN